MAVASEPERRFSVSNIISRFRSKRRSSTKQDTHVEQQLFHDTRPPLVPAPLPLVLPEHQRTLPVLGWTTVTFPSSPSTPNPTQTTKPSPSSEHTSHVTTSLEQSLDPVPGPHPLQAAYEDLFTASQTFFAQPESEKRLWKHKLGSEEGWSRIPGEKEFIALRTLEYCPEVLRGPAKRYWDLIGAQCSSTLGRISTSLGLPEEALTQYIGPCGVMQEKDEQKTATMLRLFRYEGSEEKVVAEAHADLGLLSVVVGNVPGLEVWDGRDWFDVEREVQRAERKGATLLSGRQLERLSNGRWPAGGHRVVSYGLSHPSVSPPAFSADQHDRYRYSIVFVLRAHEPIPIFSHRLETHVTGKWDEPIDGVTAGVFYERIRKMHFNINIEVDEREKQRRNLETVKTEGGFVVSG